MLLFCGKVEEKVGLDQGLGSGMQKRNVLVFESRKVTSKNGGVCVKNLVAWQKKDEIPMLDLTKRLQVRRHKEKSKFGDERTHLVFETVLGVRRVVSPD